MTKFADDSVMDGALAVTQTANDYHLCSGDPTTRAEVLAQSLANPTLAFTGPADGDVSGRKLTVNAQNDVPATGTGTIATACLIDASILLAKTDLASTLPVTGSDLLNVGAWDQEIADPS